jgi:hypothetical protein
MFLRKATVVSGYIDVGTQGLQLEARLTFLDAQEAELAARALKLVFEVLLLQEGSAQTKVPKWEMQSEATDVVVRCFVPISTVAQLLGLR